VFDLCMIVHERTVRASRGAVRLRTGGKIVLPLTITY
jgi:hypothetical protein